MASDLSAEARLRNYQHLIWTQQQIHLQIQQQQLQQQQQQQQQQQHHPTGHQQEQHKPCGEVAGLGPSSLLATTSMPPGGMPSSSSEASSKPPTQNGEEKGKEVQDPWDCFDVQTAFLGPSLWEKRMPYDGQDFKLEYMDLEDFLTENGIPVDSSNESAFSGTSSKGAESVLSPRSDMVQPTTSAAASLCSPQSPYMTVPFMPGPSRATSGLMSGLPNLARSVTSTCSRSSRSPSPCGSSSSLMHDGPQSVAPDGVQDGLQKPKEPKVDVPFSIADVALASTPGHNFDPTTRVFSEEELKPQPMVKKSRKQFVPDEQKDAKYWSRRKKNNMAAKRSRDARRVKENQIALRASFLEKENQALRQELERSQKENAVLQEQIGRCHREHQAN